MKNILLIWAILMVHHFVIGQSITFQVLGACGMCQDRIEETALSTIGVTSASYNLDEQMLTVGYMDGLFDEMELHKNLAMVGHTTNKVKVSKEVYDALPMCCQYSAIEEEVIGMVYDNTGKNKTVLIGANVYWAGTTVGTTTDLEGGFRLPMVGSTDLLVISYIGYSNDTIQVERPGVVDITLDNSIQMETIEIVYRNTGTEISALDPIKTKKISRKELTKAACCNLSESFETNPSVDVSFTDAVTGTRQIEMLGLAGPYIQITREGIPDIRGLAALDGFTFIPGPWVEGIQMNLGTGSVINGYESVAGQINVELKKPHDEELLHINGYANMMGRLEGNAVGNFAVGNKLRSNLMAHYSNRSGEIDQNKDGFLDNPKNEAVIISNRWQYDNGDGQEGQFGFKTTLTNRNGGTIDRTSTQNSWISDAEIAKHDLWIKRGMVFKNKPYMSIGMMLNGTYNDVKSNYGSRLYNANQKLLYGNFLFSTIIGDTDHKVTTGMSFLGEQYDEEFSDYKFARNEYVPGVFGEYSYSKEEKIDLVLGLRGDYHNNYGLFITPRLHFRYALNEYNILRATAGRGQRTANILAENIGAMASSRKWIIASQEGSNNPYGLNPEVAWNYGLNYTFMKEEWHKLAFSMDYYFTNFQNQIVVDYDQNPQELHVYNLDGRSFSHSFQTQLDFSPIERFDIRLAYRYNDVQTTYQRGQLWKPLNSRNRVFTNLAYETKSGWKFDYTVNLIGSKRLPITNTNPAAYQLASESPSFYMHNAQISKVLGKLEVYLGGENLGNFVQDNAIVSSEAPNNEFFDASMVWGPVFGRNIYAGFRYIIAREED